MELAQYREQKGPYRPYYKANVVLPWRFDAKDWVLVSTLTAALLAHSIAKTSQIPAQTVFTAESEFWQAATDYANRALVPDSWPPLAKQVFSYVWIFGGSARAARYTSSIFYSLTAVNVYLVGCAKGYSSVACAVPCLCLFASSRFPVLVSPDTMYLWLVSCVALAQARLMHVSLCSKQWLLLFVGQGVALSLALSTKFSAVLVWVWLVVLHLKQANRVLLDLSLPAARVLSRYLCVAMLSLAVLPVATFFVCSMAHMQSASSVPATYSETFKRSIGLPAAQEQTSEPYLNVIYGSTVTLRHYDSLGGYLSSENVSYTSGSMQQHVKVFPGVPDKWVIEHRNAKENRSIFERRKYVADSDMIRLRHLKTGKYLRVNTKRGPISQQEYDFEVACADSPSDISFNWQIWTTLYYSQNRIANDPGDSIIHPEGTVFRLMNRGERCDLLSHNTRYDDASEVICVKDSSLLRRNFYIEFNDHPLLHKDARQEKVEYKRLTQLELLREYSRAVWLHYRDIALFENPTGWEVYPYRWLLEPCAIYEGNQELFRLPTSVQFFALFNMLFFFGKVFGEQLRSIRWYGQLLFSEHFEAAAGAEKSLGWHKYVAEMTNESIGWVIQYFGFKYVDRHYLSTNYVVGCLFLVLSLGDAAELVYSRVAERAGRQRTTKA